jgi:hypothetical protein
VGEGGTVTVDAATDEHGRHLTVSV